MMPTALRRQGSQVRILSGAPQNPRFSSLSLKPALQIIAGTCAFKQRTLVQIPYSLESAVRP